MLDAGFAERAHFCYVLVGQPGAAAGLERGGAQGDSYVTSRDGHPARFWIRFLGRSRFNPLVWIAGALAAGVVAVGVLFLLQVLFQPTQPAETEGYEIFEGERFRIWHAEASDVLAAREALESELARQLEEVARLLALSADEVPERMDVFVHDSVAEMQETLRRRAGFERTKLHDAALDVIAGNPLRASLAEVLLYFGWGESFSQAIYAGLLRYVTDPKAPFLLTVKAAPDRLRHSLDDLAYLEETGRYPATVYQQLTGPMAPGDVTSFLGTRSLITMPESIASSRSDDFHVIEMASLIQYVAENLGGLGRLKEIWGPGGCGTVLVRCDPVRELADLEADWERAVEDSGDVETLDSYTRARLFYEAGQLESSYALVQAWGSHPEVHPLAERAFAVRCALSVGAFEDAAAWTASLDAGIRAEYERLVGIYDGWRRHETPDFSLFAPADAIDSSDLLLEIDAAYETMMRRVGLWHAEEILHPTFFVYSDVVQRNIGRNVGPSDSTNVNAVHLVLGDEVQFDMTERLLPRLWSWWPASPLVRVGIVSALSKSYDELVSAGIDLACSGAWFPFSSLAATLGDRHTLRTEAGLLFAYIEQISGLEGLRRFWMARRVRELASLEGALQSFLGTTRAEIERSLLEDVLGCP